MFGFGQLRTKMSINIATHTTIVLHFILLIHYASVNGTIIDSYYFPIVLKWSVKCFSAIIISAVPLICMWFGRYMSSLVLNPFGKTTQTL